MNIDLKDTIETLINNTIEKNFGKDRALEKGIRENEAGVVDFWNCFGRTALHVIVHEEKSGRLHIRIPDTGDKLTQCIFIKQNKKGWKKLEDHIMLSLNYQRKKLKEHIEETHKKIARLHELDNQRRKDIEAFYKKWFVLEEKTIHDE